LAAGIASRRLAAWPGSDRHFGIPAVAPQTFSQPPDDLAVRGGQPAGSPRCARGTAAAANPVE